MRDSIEIGDTVEVSYIMFEDSSPQWVPHFTGTVTHVEGPDHGPDVEIVRDDTGEVKEVSTGCSAIVRAV